MTPQVTEFNDIIGGVNGNMAIPNTIRWTFSGGLTWSTSANHTSPNLAPLIQSIIDTKNGLNSSDHIQLWIYSPDLNHNAEVACADYTNGLHFTTLSMSWDY